MCVCCIVLRDRLWVCSINRSCGLPSGMPTDRETKQEVKVLSIETGGGFRLVNAGRILSSEFVSAALTLTGRRYGSAATRCDIPGFQQALKKTSAEGKFAAVQAGEPRMKH